MENKNTDKKIGRNSKPGEFIAGFLVALFLWFTISYVTIMSSDRLLVISLISVAVSVLASLIFLKDRRIWMPLGMLVFLAAAVLLPGPCSIGAAISALRSTPNGERCDSHSQCVSNNCYARKCCDVGQCNTNGESCGSSNQCFSKNCINGVCCDVGQCTIGGKCIDSGFYDYGNLLCDSGNLYTTFNKTGCTDGPPCQKGITCNTVTDRCEYKSEY